MEIEVFAVLKEYFDKQFSVSASIENIASLKQHLQELNPEAKSVLKSCRFAVDDEFVNDTYTLKENDSISIIPPSSGG
jgi:molybdopterin synthase sulfur carrier subunit